MTTGSAAALGLLAADPIGLGGVRLRGEAGPHRDQWLASLRARLRPGTPWVALPVAVDQDRLDGGLDLAASLAAGRPVRAPGLIAAATGGLLLIHRVDRLPPTHLGSVLAALDRGEVGVVVFDETRDDDPPPPAALLDRLAFSLELDPRQPVSPPPPVGYLETAAVRMAEGSAALLCRLATACGIRSLRPPVQAVRAARLAAAIAGREQVTEADLQLAAELVLAPRAEAVPAELPPPPSAEETPPDPPPTDADGTGTLDDRILAATRAALPPSLLASLATTARRAGTAGRTGASVRGQTRGRTIGARAGDPRRGRLHLYATLLTAAPWQRVRRRSASGRKTRFVVHRADLRIKRLVHQVGTTTVFAVDASGSAALHRLAEAKGAVEALLAESYVRRDQVAMVAFRGTEATVVLPPTRSLTRARRALAGMAGGGGTPLAAGISVAHEVALHATRAGTRAVLVLLTDGRANIDRNGTAGRPAAEADALTAARAVAAAAIPTIVIDVAPRPNPFAATLAAEFGARYLPLPSLDGDRVGREVRSALGPEAAR